MSLFKRKNTLLKRIEALEEELGLFYTVDSDKYASYHVEHCGYGKLNSIIKDIADLKGKK